MIIIIINKICFIIFVGWNLILNGYIASVSITILFGIYGLINFLLAIFKDPGYIKDK